MLISRVLVLISGVILHILALNSASLIPLNEALIDLLEKYDVNVMIDFILEIMIDQFEMNEIDKFVYKLSNELKDSFTPSRINISFTLLQRVSKEYENVPNTNQLLGHYYQYYCNDLKSTIIMNNDNIENIITDYCTQMAVRHYDMCTTYIESFSKMYNIEYAIKYLPDLEFNYMGMLNDLGLITMNTPGKASYYSQMIFERAWQYFLIITSIDKANNLEVAHHQAVPALVNYAYLLDSWYDRTWAGHLYSIAVVHSKDSNIEPQVWHNYGTFLYKSKDAKKRSRAIEVWTEAVQLPNFNDADLPTRTDIATHLCTKGNLESADQYFDKLIYDATERLIQIDLSNEEGMGERENKENIEFASHLREFISGVLFMKLAGIVPQIILSHNQANATRLQYINNLQALLQATQINNGLSFLIRTYFSKSNSSSVGVDSGSLSITNHINQRMYDHDNLQYPLQISRPAATLGCTSLGYYLIYDGGDNYQPKLLLAEVYRNAVPHLKHDDAVTISSSSSSGSSGRSKGLIKVGFISRFWFWHSVGLLLEGVVSDLSSDEFDLTLIVVDGHTNDISNENEDVYVPVGGSDHVSHRIAQHMKKRIQMNRGRILTIKSNEDIQNSRLAIRALDLDILIYGELGMNLLTYELAFSTLSKRTAVFWGHATTSGISPSSINMVNKENKENKIDEGYHGGIDYFIASELIETKENQRSYTEKLVLMKNLSFSFRKPTLPQGIPVTIPTKEEMSNVRLELMDRRRSFLLNLDASLQTKLPHDVKEGGVKVGAGPMTIYGIPQTLYKLHPDLDVILINVLIQDPQGYIMLPRGNHDSSWIDVVLNRLRTSITDAISQLQFNTGIDGNNKITVESIYSRILLLPTMTKDEFLKFVGFVDVILDTFPVGGGRSSLEIFATGTPIVVLYPRTSILQLTTGMYKAMGLYNSYNLVTFNIQDYCNIAVQIATDINLQYEIRHEILSRNKVLYFESNKEVVREWERILRYMVEHPRPFIYDEEFVKNKRFLHPLVIH